jgi:hypothetical protein
MTEGIFFIIAYVPITSLMLTLPPSPKKNRPLGTNLLKLILVYKDPDPEAN